MSRKLTQLELLSLAFEGAESRINQNKQLKEIIVDMYREEVALQQAQADAQAQQDTNKDTVQSHEDTSNETQE